MVQYPFLLLIPLAAIIAAFLIAWVIAKPLALLAYLRAVREAQERYYKRYMPFIVLPEQDTHQLILGLPGAGKTTALHVYEHTTSQKRWTILRGNDKLPAYIPLKDYSLFLKTHQQINPANAAAGDSWEQRTDSREAVQNMPLLAFLGESDLPGMRHLRPYLKKLTLQGRIVFLCDGLDEMDNRYRDAVCAELAYLIRWTRNRLLLTCREVDYRAQPRLQQLVDDGHIVCVELLPLQPEQIREFVERYVSEQGDQWRHTAGQILEVINHSRLLYHCTNPMMLFTLMEIIDELGVERGKQIDTRSLLLREFVVQLIKREQRQPRWRSEVPVESAVIMFLGEIACAARWANDRNTIQLPVSTRQGKAKRVLHSEELAQALQVWLDEHAAQGPFATNAVLQHEPYERAELARLVQFARSAGLIDISPQGVLSFRHELIADYLLAEYFYALDSSQQLPIREELLADASSWATPVAFWAGLSDDPTLLAERLVLAGQSNPAYLLEAVTLSLLCIGVLWTPPQAEVQRPIVLPPSVEETLVAIVRDAETREKLAHIFTRCAEEGGYELYGVLLPLLTVEGIDRLLVLLDEKVVPGMLFSQLSEVIDDAAYEAQVKRLIQVLGRFGGAAVAHATEWSQPVPGRSLRLRAAMVNILGGTNDQLAVEPLIARLSDPEPFIRGRTINALIRLGPERTLARLIQELAKRTAAYGASQIIHRAVLTILARFLEEQDARQRVTPTHRQRMLEAIVSVLSSHYAPETQQQAMEILVRQGSTASARDSGGDGGEKVVAILTRNLSSEDETMTRNVVQTLQQIGTVATPLLVTQLKQQPSEIVRMRIVEVFEGTLDQRALPHILRLLADPAPLVQQQAASALRTYAPESTPDLIKLVLFDTSEAVATRAAQILGDIGEEVIVPVMQALDDVVPGRTRLLVQVLEHVHDSQAIPALITLLETPQIEPLLAVSIVHALSQYPDVRVVPPLIDMLASSNVQLYEEAVNALSHLGEVAFDGLIAALNVEQETLTTPRVRRALLGMVPFPGEQLIDALALGSEAQARQIVAVLLAKGSDAAQMLVNHLAHPDDRTRGYVHYTLARMEGHIAVPALLEMLNRPTLRPAVDELLHMYPQEAIPSLVSLLGDDERGDAAAAILLKIGPMVLPLMVPGLDDVSSAARERAQSTIVNLVRQSPEILPQVVGLFGLSLPERARESLLEVLTDDLADPVGPSLAGALVPALLEELDDAHLIEGVSEALVRLVHKRDAQSDVALRGLFDALRMEERQRGAKIVLVNAGEQAVPGLINLITDADPSVAQAAQQILRDIGVAAFPSIWAASSDVSNRMQREAALHTFRSMPTVEIKDGLIEHLLGDKIEDISMALSLLLERLFDEATLPRANQEMIRVLLEYVQTQSEERAARRIIALLLLVGGSDVANHMAWGLYHYHDHPNHEERLTRAFLLLGEEAEEVLLEMLRYRGTPPELLAEVVGILGMMAPYEEVYEYAKTVSGSNTSLLQTRQMIALRALGGLLAGGHLNTSTLQSQQATSLYGSPEHELYSVLLGRPYGPVIKRLENDLRTVQYEFEKDRRVLNIQLSLVEREKEELEGEIRELEERNQQLEQINQQLAESNQRLQQRLRNVPG